MSAKLLAYRYVPPGFEIVIDNPDVEIGKVWNLWWNVKLSDDPESWDAEIHLLNEMQARLGKLTTDQRLIRAQMAEFCRFCPILSRSIDILCEEIGTGRFSKPLKMGCEGRGLLDALGFHDPQSLAEQRRAMLRGYARALRKWLEGGHARDPLESNVFGFLGHATAAKENYVQSLIQVVDSEGFSIASLKKLVASTCEEAQHRAISEIQGRPFNCFHCEGCPDEPSAPHCPCCHAMLLDAGLLCAGASGEARTMLDEFSRCIQEYVLAYALAINLWLQDAPPKPVTSWVTTRYVEANHAAELAANVYSSLGEKDKIKEWLAVCLLKTIKDNQRWHKTHELIDDLPEVTSWFG